MDLRLGVCSIRQAQRFVAAHHRRLPRVQGGLWAVSVVGDDGETLGVAIVGWPARVWMDSGVLSVVRVAVAEGAHNACSMLYGACSRAARALGATDLVTYTHADEPGTSLRAAGWVMDGATAGGDWGRESRPRQPALFPDSKVRWFAPWGERARGLKG